MNESIKNMIERRSVRGYKPDMIPKEDLDLILEAGTYAATGMGMQSPVIVAVTDKATRDQLSKEQAAENPPQAEEDLLTAAVNRAILTGFSTLYQELVEKEHLVPVTDPDFELLAVNRAEGFRAGAEFYCLPPLELERYTGFTQPIQPRPIRQVSIELEVNTRHGDVFPEFSA